MISRVASFTSSSRPAGDDRRPSITSESDWCIRIDAGTLFDMGCLLAGAGSHRRRFASPQRGCIPTKFSSKIRPSPRAIPRSPEKRDKPVRAVLGGLFGDARWLNTWKVIYDTLIDKGRRYGNLDAPLVIAVNANVFHLDQSDIMQALFGQEQFLFDPHEPDREPRMQRAPNGFWHGPKGPRYARVAGVLIGFDVSLGRTV